jgi:hypothetical protein
VNIVELIRLEDSYDGTFGVLKINKEAFCVTLEPPDNLNSREKSCIPAQQYVCNRYKSPTYGDTFIVQNVPNRSGILFHPGNTRKDTAGCIIVAQHFGKIKGFRAILNSGETFKEFMEIMKDERHFHLTIKEVY